MPKIIGALGTIPKTSEVRLEELFEKALKLSTIRVVLGVCKDNEKGAKNLKRFTGIKSRATTNVNIK